MLPLLHTACDFFVQSRMAAILHRHCGFVSFRDSHGIVRLVAHGQGPADKTNSLSRNATGMPRRVVLWAHR